MGMHFEPSTFSGKGLLNSVLFFHFHIVRNDNIYNMFVQCHPLNIPPVNRPNEFSKNELQPIRWVALYVYYYHLKMAARQDGNLVSLKRLLIMNYSQSIDFSKALCPYV